jgi:hypothetical protein
MTRKGFKKYGNKPVTIDGIWFQSTKEGKRWCELKLLERAGVITDLKRQVKFELTPETVRSDGKVEDKSTYTADFVYTENGKNVIEDSKGFRTPDYKLLRKMMLFIHGIEILET